MGRHGEGKNRAGGGEGGERRPSNFLPPPPEHPACAFVASWAGLQSHANPSGLLVVRGPSREGSAGVSNATYSRPLSQLMFLFWAPHYFLL